MRDRGNLPQSLPSDFNSKTKGLKNRGKGKEKEIDERKRKEG